MIGSNALGTRSDREGHQRKRGEPRPQKDEREAEGVEQHREGERDQRAGARREQALDELGAIERVREDLVQKHERGEGHQGREGPPHNVGLAPGGPAVSIASRSALPSGPPATKRRAPPRSTGTPKSHAVR